MRIISASVARNIANESVSNKSKVVIEQAMNSILRKAEQGEHSVTICFPKAWSMEIKMNISSFFIDLDYEVNLGIDRISLNW